MSEETKKCGRCKATKPLTEFGKDSRSPDSRSYRCKRCHRAEVRASERRHRKVRAEIQRRWRKENPEKVTAHDEVRRAVKYGRMIKPDVCADCAEAKDDLHAHHHDYNKPLDVEWLCGRCHRIRHGQEETKSVA